MGQKELSLLLKVVVVVLTVFLAAVLIFFVPMLGSNVADYYAGDPVKTAVFGCVVPGIVAASSVPGFIALWLAWRIWPWGTPASTWSWPYRCWRWGPSIPRCP